MLTDIIYILDSIKVSNELVLILRYLDVIHSFRISIIILQLQTL